MKAHPEDTEDPMMSLFPPTDPESETAEQLARLLCNGVDAAVRLIRSLEAAIVGKRMR